ncbi:hypothetical protein OXX59_009799, partial [Metschnikowia pulcherrima]
NYPHHERQQSKPANDGSKENKESLESYSVQAVDDETPESFSISKENSSSNAEYTSEKYVCCKFVWDSGSAAHIVSDESLLRSKKPCARRFRTLNSTFESTFVGDVVCELADRSILILREVYCVPGVHTNLIAAGQVREFQTAITDEKLKRLDTDHIIGHVEDKLPIVRVKVHTADNASMVLTAKTASDHIISDESSSAGSGDATDSEADEDVSIRLLYPSSSDSISLESRVWHTKLGHPSARQFALWCKVLNLQGLRHVPSIHCAGCMLSKPTLVRPKQSDGLTEVTQSFEILHVDLSGPFETPRAYDNTRYFLTIVDRYSRYVAAIPLKYKTEAATELVKFMRQSFTNLKSSHYPRQIRSDNGSEFVNDNVRNFLDYWGIEARYTQSHSSHQNGIAERMNRTLQDKARTLLLHSNVPLPFWSEAIRTAAYILNWTPRPSLDDHAPMERWLRKSAIPKLPDFHPFGCWSHVRYPKALRTSKFGPITVECAYLGPSVARSGHRFFTYDPPHVFESDQADFDDTRFYFREYFVDDAMCTKIHNSNRLPSTLLPCIKYPPSAKKRTKNENEENFRRLQELFAPSTYDPSVKKLTSGNSPLLEHDLTSPSKRAKANPGLRGSLGQATSPASDSSHLSDIRSEPAPSPQTSSTSTATDQQSSSPRFLPSESLSSSSSTPKTGSPDSTSSSNRTSSTNSKNAKKLEQSKKTSKRKPRVNTKNSIPKVTRKPAKSSASKADPKPQDQHSSSDDVGLSTKKRLTPPAQMGDDSSVPFQNTRSKTRRTILESHSVFRGRNDATIREPPKCMLVKVTDERNKTSTTMVRTLERLHPNDGENRADSLLSSHADSRSRENSLIEENSNVLLALFVESINHVGQSSDITRPVPNSYTEAKRSPEWDKWKKACEAEIAAHIRNGTFKPVRKTADIKPIGCRWVFAIKDDERYKARLVARGYTQVEGIDYAETFSPVIKQDSIRLIFAIAAKLKMSIHHIDVSTAFLYGTLEEDIYMIQPPGFKFTPDGQKDDGEYVLKLQKSLYGLKQSPLVWNETLNKEFLKQGFKRAINEPCIYYKGEGKNALLVGVYVDDMLIVGANQKQIDKVKKDLSNRFEMKDLGPVKKFLGINVLHGKDFRVLHLSDYIDSILRDYGMLNCNGVNIPIPPKDLDANSEDDNEPCDQKEYRSIIGKLLYAANCVRFDINYVVSRLSRYLSDPREKHMRAAKRVIRYLSKTRTYGI